MTRELTFRNVYQHDETGMMSIVYDIDLGRPFPVMPRRSLLDTQQFTGLLDKEGRRIYEGDLVQSKDHNPSIMEVRFVEGGFCAWWGSDDYPIDINHFYDSLGCHITVIGNIYDNPDLVPGRKE